MKLIDKNITDIISGFDDILEAETKLRAHWRPQLLAAYTHRKVTLERDKKLSIGRKIRSMVSMLLGIGFILVGIGFSCRGILQNEGNIYWYCCGGPLLVVFGLLILGAIWFSLKTRKKTKSSPVPLHPIRSGKHQKGIYPDIRTTWMERLSGKLIDEVPDYPDYLDKDEKDHGAQGERIFIQRLRENIDDHYYVLARSMQRPREDVDIILIGPKGIWVFEIKHWSGEIFWDDQGWRRVQTYYKRGGVEVTRQPDVGEPPNQQWIRAAAQVSRTLQSHAIDILARYPGIEQVRGGIVFTKEEAILKFQPGRPVFWGTISFWIKTLHEVEIKADLDTRSTLQLVEILLDQHHELASTRQKRSMQTYAQDIVQVAENRLEEWAQM